MPLIRGKQAVGLFFDLEKAYETTWQYGIIRDLHRIGLRGSLPVFVSEYLMDQRIRDRIGTKLSDEFYLEEGVPTGGVLAVSCFGLKINELPSCVTKDIFKALFVNDLAICFRGRSLDTIRDIYSRQWMPYRNGRQGTASGLQPTSAKSYISLQHGLGLRDPPLWGFFQWRSPRSSSGWVRTRTSHLRSTSVCWRQCKEALNLIRVFAHLKWGGDRDTLLMLYRAIVRSKFDYGCIVYGTASNTNLRQVDSIHNSGLRLALRAFCTSPVSSLHTEDNEAPLEERR